MAAEEVAVELRHATFQDRDAVVDMVMAMLREMAEHGGHALNEEDRVRARLRKRFTNSLVRDDHVYLLKPGEDREGQLAGVVEASVVSPCEVFRQKRVVHVHALYVRPGRRGRGIGRGLLEATLIWSRAKGCSEAKLNVLAGNPARGLYERAGFDVFELEMRLVL